MPLSMQIAELAGCCERQPDYLSSDSNLTFKAHVKIIWLAVIVSISVSLKHQKQNSTLWWNEICFSVQLRKNKLFTSWTFSTRAEENFRDFYGPSLSYMSSLVPSMALQSLCWGEPITNKKELWGKIFLIQDQSPTLKFLPFSYDFPRTVLFF